MANLKEIRTRITTVKSTKQITSAMKMVSAAKLKKAQDNITQMRPYAEKLQEILQNLSQSVNTEEGNVYAEKRDIKRVLLIAITSNRGLCGAFNSNVIKATMNTVKSRYLNEHKNGNLDVICIGKKGYEALKKKELNVIEDKGYLFDDLTFENAVSIINPIMKQFVDGEYDQVELIYNRFKNAATQIIQEENFLPIKIDEDNSDEAEKDAKSENVTPYFFEPSKEYIVNQIIPDSLRTQFFKALLDSLAAEHGARMTAMHKATDNATELVKELNLTYNKARQAAITKEILEITGGAEALNA